MSEEVNEEVVSIGMFELIRRMLSPRTLPHIVLVAIISGILMAMVSSYEGISAILFLSFSASYGILALLSSNTTILNLTKLPEESSEGAAIVRLAKSFRICIVPILLALVITGIMWSLFGQKNEWIVTLLASLFVVWSITQARSFRTGMVEWFSNGLGDAKLHTYREKLSTASQIVIVQVFAILVIWIGQVMTAAESMTIGDAILGGFLFILGSVLFQVFALWLTRDEREKAGNEKGLSGFSFKWMVTAQLFITWHCFSIYRRKMMDPSTASTLIEESILMGFTVLFAVWALTSKTVKDQKRLINEDSALPLGVSFGYAYAGSVAMLTGTFDEIENVLVFGHILTIIAILFILNSTLRARRITSADLAKARGINIETSDDGEDEVKKEKKDTADDSADETDVSEGDESWQGDSEVDWENPEDIGKGAEWSESDKDSEQ